MPNPTAPIRVTTLEEIALRPGDVCNRFGDIRGIDSGDGQQIIKAGKVFVSDAQAAMAERYGWKRGRVVDDEVVIGRTIGDRLDAALAEEGK